ncbi:glycosyltransferase family 2 protein [Roseiconus lacunae]|uniref:glycosyltransferase family 2 protein n=1 Tax=Roseiconus lacunae TaxID=2605694 RepID=UPI001E319166|nr:glycosyltransferase [Roseiconus lacunae]MCD0459863.1 glycosyltransferase [Roseiconus lacunae]
MANSPLVSIIIPIYNAAHFLPETLRSVSEQRFTDWELILVDDGSSDDSLSIAHRFAVDHGNTKVIGNSCNQGLPTTLNIGLAQARGDYIARLDADDQMLPTRLQEQVDFLDCKPEIGLLGSSAITIDGDGNPRGTQQMPHSDEDIRWHETTGRASSFLHPSVMMRAAVLRDHGLTYDTMFAASQDKQLWFEMLQHCKGANLKTPLIYYRRHGGSISETKRTQQSANAERVCHRWVEQLLGRQIPSSAVCNLVRSLRREVPVGEQTLALMMELLDSLTRQPNCDPKNMKSLRVRVLMRLLRFHPLWRWPEMIRNGLLKIATDESGASSLVRSPRP